MSDRPLPDGAREMTAVPLERIRPTCPRCGVLVQVEILPLRPPAVLRYALKCHGHKERVTLDLNELDLKPYTAVTFKRSTAGQVERIEEIDYPRAFEEQARVRLQACADFLALL